VSRGKTRRAAADNDDGPRMLCLVSGRLGATDGKFLPHEHAVTASLDTPTEDGIERRHTQHLTGA
jgi:hypothetical protein